MCVLPWLRINESKNTFDACAMPSSCNATAGSRGLRTKRLVSIRSIGCVVLCCDTNISYAVDRTPHIKSFDFLRRFGGHENLSRAQLQPFTTHKTRAYRSNLYVRYVVWLLRGDWKLSLGHSGLYCMLWGWKLGKSMARSLLFFTLL